LCSNPVDRFSPLTQIDAHDHREQAMQSWRLDLAARPPLMLWIS